MEWLQQPASWWTACLMLWSFAAGMLAGNLVGDDHELGGKVFGIALAMGFGFMLAAVGIGR